MGEQYMTWIWLALTLILVIAEAATAQLTTVWFALGAFVAFLMTLFGVKNIALQIVVFAAVSLLALILTRPLVKKLLQKRVQPTNADRSIGQIGKVTQTINNIEGCGEVNLKGTIWTARSEDNGEIEAGEFVKVLRIEGVKLIVEKTKQEE